MNTTTSFAIDTLLCPESMPPEFPSFAPLLPITRAYVGNFISIAEKYNPNSLCLFDELTQQIVHACHHSAEHRHGRIPLVPAQKDPTMVIVACTVRHRIGAFKNPPGFIIAYELADMPGQWAYKRIRIYGSRSKCRQRRRK